MLVHKFIKPNIFQTTQTTMNANSTKVQEFYSVRYKGVWYNINDQKLETAIAVTKGLKPRWVSVMSDKELYYFKTHHLPQSENNEDSVKW